MAKSLNPKVTWSTGSESEVVLNGGRITLRMEHTTTTDYEADLIYRALLAARRARRAGVVHL